MIIDFHTHIFPQSVQKQRDRFFEDEPAFQLLYDSEKSKIIGADQLIDAMDKDGIDRSVIFGFPWKHADFFKQNNDTVLEAVEKYPDRLVGFCCLDPFHQDSEREVERCLDAGLSGIGELAFYESGFSEETINRLSPIMKMAHQRKKCVMIHTNEPVGHIYPGKTPVSIKEIYNLVKRFSENKIILAHWGGGIFFYHMLKSETKDVLKNVYVDTAASLYLYDERIWSVACQIIGSEKIVFGTDYPLISANRYFKQINASGITKSDKENILGKTAEMILV
ncbi:amidohydrolase 2 [Candidatus Magnetomorum sp. HK-1]|nr:amidohydrolase 2 [Candidatus Magnetomorum sp. HK-1]